MLEDINIAQFQYRLGLMTSMAGYGKENSAETNNNICELKDLLKSLLLC